jgi:hypothetical protein
MTKTEVDVWYGDSNTSPFGPIKGVLIEENLFGYSKVEIVDEKWLDEMGWEGEYIAECERLPNNFYVSYDAYAWSYPGECDLKTRFDFY